MTADEVLSRISELAPFEYAEGWDNVGLLVGNGEKEVKSIYLAVDATDEIIENAISNGADMLLTHHPMIFSPLKKIVASDFVGRRVLRLCEADMAYAAMHTNFDIMGMADAAADDLSLKNCEVLETVWEDDIAKAGFGRIGELSEKMSLGVLAEIVKEAFNVPTVRVFGDLDLRVKKAAILPGSGKSGILAAINGGADVFITGDIDHHDGIDAVARGLAIIDAGHYGIEKLFISYMENYILRELPGIKVITERPREPFTTV